MPVNSVGTTSMVVSSITTTVESGILVTLATKNWPLKECVTAVGLSKSNVSNLPIQANFLNQ